MSEQENEPTKQDRSVDALEAMAAGQNLWPDSKDEPSGPQSAPPVDPLPPSRQSSPEEIEARKARAEALRIKAREVRAHHFRNLMIPMLLVTAVLLLLLATIAAFMLPTAEEAQYYPDNMLGKPWAKYLIYAAFPLSLILLAGAAIFWQDVRRSRIKTGNGAGKE